jgi:hypothetical protein
MDEEKHCPKCNSTLDKSNLPMGLMLVQNQGTIEKPDFVPAGKIGAMAYPYLCHQCGFIELYAPVGNILRSMPLSQGRLQ